LATIDKRVRACFFVSGFAEQKPDDIEPFKTLNRPFVEGKINWGKVIKNSKTFICLHGDDDPYVPVDFAQNFAVLIDAKDIILIPKGGHLNKEFGYTEFPLLIKTIKKELKI